MNSVAITAEIERLRAVVVELWSSRAGLVAKVEQAAAPDNTFYNLVADQIDKLDTRIDAIEQRLLELHNSLTTALQQEQAHRQQERGREEGKCLFVVLLRHIQRRG